MRKRGFLSFGDLETLVLEPVLCLFPHTRGRGKVLKVAWGGSRYFFVRPNESPLAGLCSTSKRRLSYHSTI